MTDDKTRWLQGIGLGGGGGGVKSHKHMWGVLPGDDCAAALPGVVCTRAICRTNVHFHQWNKVKMHSKSLREWMHVLSMRDRHRQSHGSMLLFVTFTKQIIKTIEKNEWMKDGYFSTSLSHIKTRAISFPTEVKMLSTTQHKMPYVFWLVDADICHIPSLDH